MLAFACSLLLPTIWIVDVQMGLGAHFADIPAAISAAANGDTILVRAGTYTSFALIGKAVTVRGEGGAATRIVGTPAAIAVQVVNSGGAVVLSGLRLEGSAPAVLLMNSFVTLLDCDLIGVDGLGLGGIGLTATDSQVVTSRCTFTGGAASGSLVALGGDAMRIGAGSTLVADQCVFVGGNAAGLAPGIQIVGRGLLCSDSARLDRRRLRGGNGAATAGVGIEVAAGGTVRLAGDATAYVASGFAGGQLALAVRNQSSTVVRHAPVSVLGTVFGTISPGPTLPSLQVDGAARTDGTLDALQPVQVTLDGLVPNGFGFVAFGDPVFASPVPPFASELLVGGAGAAVFVTPLDASGRAQFAYTPALIGGPLVGVPVHLQGGAWNPVLGSVLTSNLDVHLALL